MDDRTHHHGTHGHGGRVHVHASVDHLASDSGLSARLAIRLDSAVMETLGVAAIKRTNFVKVAAPTVSDMLEAIKAAKAEKSPGDNNNG